jgi:hypothetical protein
MRTSAGGSSVAEPEGLESRTALAHHAGAAPIHAGAAPHKERRRQDAARKNKRPDTGEPPTEGVSHMSTLFRKTLICLVAVFAFSAIAATGAQAAASVKGPFYKIEKVRLQNLESREIEDVQNGNQVLTAGTKIITCTTLKSTGYLEGSHNENAGKSYEKIEYTGCTVTGNGSPCSVTTPITAEVEDIQGYAEKVNAHEGTGQLLTIFKPWSEASPLVFVEIHFTGTGCEVLNTKVETTEGGGVCGEDINGVGAHVTTTANQTEAETNEVLFPATAVKTIWLETGGNLAEAKCGLKAFGATATLSGKVKVKLVSKKTWGVFTK